MGRGGKPLWSFCSLGDTGNGFLSAIAIIQALYHRERTGEGQFCDTSIVNAQLLNTSYAFARPDGIRLRAAARRRRCSSGSAPPTGSTRRADGWLCIVAATEEHWDRLCVAIGTPALAADARFATRRRAPRTTRHWRRCSPRGSARRRPPTGSPALDAAGVPCEICDPGFALGLHDDAEFRRRGWIVIASASLRGPAGPDRRRVRLLRHAGARAGPAARSSASTAARCCAELGYTRRARSTSSARTAYSNGVRARVIDACAVPGKSQSRQLTPE